MEESQKKDEKKWNSKGMREKREQERVERKLWQLRWTELGAEGEESSCSGEREE